MHQKLDDSWREWLHLNIQRGCDQKELLHLAVKHGLNNDEVSEFISAWASGQKDLHHTDFRTKLTIDTNRFPQASRINSASVELYTIPGFLCESDCKTLVKAIDDSLVASTITHGSNTYRTSHTSHLYQVAPELAHGLDIRLSSLLNTDPLLSEPVQGQRYDRGQYFKAHTDWFQPGSTEYFEHARIGGQRTWTVMVYLNSVKRGGETRFRDLGISFLPRAGMALAWNNLNPDGSPNHATLHEAMPIIRGRKYVITKWFRMARGLMPNSNSM